MFPIPTLPPSYIDNLVVKLLSRKRVFKVLLVAPLPCTENLAVAPKPPIFKE